MEDRRHKPPHDLISLAFLPTEAKDKVLKHTLSLEADMGGTEILGPLRDLAKVAPSPEKPRQVFVITDGQARRLALWGMHGALAHFRRSIGCSFSMVVSVF
jgi:hypothetical protein